jgi:pyroglutamyl-peptidase
VFYALMHRLAQKRTTARGGFIHVPCQPELAKKGQSSLPLRTMRDAVVLAIEVATKRRRDVRQAGGSPS